MLSKKPGGSLSAHHAERIHGVPGRKWLYVFSAASTVLGIQLLYLANDDLGLNIALTLAVIGGFAFSYFLDSAYRRFAIIVLDVVAISSFVFYLNRAIEEKSTWGTDFGILLGILITLYSFRSFTERDHRMILAACLVILLLASVASYDVKLMFILPLFIFSAFASLYVANNLSLAGRIPHIASEMGSGITIAYLAGRATTAVLVASIFIYMVVPHSTGMRNPRFRLPSSTTVEEEDVEDIPDSEREEIERPNGFSGFSESLDLSKGGRIEIRDDPVLLVKGTLNDYMRGKVFDLYDGAGWKQDEEWRENHIPKISDKDLEEYTKKKPSAEYMGNVEILPLVDFPSESKMKQFRSREIYITEDNAFSKVEQPALAYSTHIVDVTFLQNDLAIFFSPYQAFRIEDISNRKVAHPDSKAFAKPKQDAYSVLRATRKGRELSIFPLGIHYKLFILKPSFAPIKLSESSNLASRNEIRMHYTQLPSLVTDNTEIMDLALAVASGSREDPAVMPYDKVRNIYDYFVFSEEFTYSLDYPDLETQMTLKPGGVETESVPTMDAAAHFALVTKRGWCEYFANAFTVFCRINGIPSRIVTGYAPGKYNFLKNGYVVSTKNAHAWAEVYFDGFGWIAFDPTPASSDFLSTGDIRNFLSTLFAFFQDLFVIDPRGVQQGIKDLAVLLATRLYQVAVENKFTSTLILLSLTGFLVISWWMRRPRREPPPIPKNAVVAAYYDVEGTLADFGWERDFGVTGRAYLERMGRSINRLSVPLMELLDLYYFYAYSNREPGGSEGSRARAIAKMVRDYFKSEKKGNGGG